MGSHIDVRARDMGMRRAMAVNRRGRDGGPSEMGRRDDTMQCRYAGDEDWMRSN
jgi:hypothetical protein